ncbi:MAG: 23S rRNA (uracil(1939)-C(5))-methyltransferase RlmD [Lachnospiraceae bacterium]|nr:23S rRNA (uracil(1939)-C(5))-methyltransferase RlmD [Lachnospiraceae bacterium]
MAKKRNKKSAVKQGSGEQIPWKKNDELILEIVDMGSEGEGIGRADGYALFVKGALPGEVIRARIMKIRKNFGYARMVEIIQASPDRVEPVCPVARQCGGCQLQHCSYERQLQWKQEKIMNCLRRIGGLDVQLPEEAEENVSVLGQQLKEKNESGYTESGTGDGPVIMEPILGMKEPYHYRNKAQFPVGYDRDGKLVAGFYAGRTHQVIPQTDCLIQHSCNHIILDTILAFMEQYQISAYQEEIHVGLVRHILIRVGKATGQVMVCLIINGKEIPHVEELIRRLQECKIEGNITSICLNRNEDRTNRILGDEIVPLYGQTYIEDCIGDIRYRISPLSFYQVNPEQTVRLYETALEYADLQGGETVWDLYCGIGTISLFLSQKADRVCGVEIVPQAVENARENARLNQIINVEFYTGAAEEVVPDQYEKSGGELHAEVVVVDPPRKGCDAKLLETVVQREPEKIVYISCDPATLARDLKYLCGQGYTLKRVRGCDMFGMSYHVETVVLLTKK